MRCELVAIALTGCTWALTDPAQPIGVVVRGLTPSDAADLAAAAECWNLQFGTQLVTGDAAMHQGQQVEAFYDRPTCLVSQAQVQGGMPVKLAVCPEQYWAALPGPYGPNITPSRVLSHELGHVLNILGHPDDSRAVMRGGGTVDAPFFRPVDIQMFDAANPGFHAKSACMTVFRAIADGHEFCQCD